MGSVRAAAALSLLVVACTSPSADAPPKTAVPVASAPAAAPPAPPAAPVTATARRLGDDDPLVAGLVTFEGVARPTKGGLAVRRVTFPEAMVRQALPKHDEAALLGARLQMTAELEERRDDPGTDGVVAQGRSGTYFAPRNLVRAVVVAEPVEIVGTVTRSKGLFSVGKRMVSRDDLAWALKGADPVGKRVRLRGQPRTYHCPPQAQCLLSGSIPMFDVGAAEFVE